MRVTVNVTRYLRLKYASAECSIAQSGFLVVMVIKINAQLFSAASPNQVIKINA